jgi:hypothetical protein
MHRSRVITLAILFVCACTAVLLACNDAETPPESTSVIGPTRAASPRYQRDIDRSKAHEDNPMDWVGVAHNRALDDYFQALRSGKPTRETCLALVEFMSDTARTPDHTAGPQVYRRAIARDVLRSRGLCASKFASRTTWSSRMLAQSTTTTVSPATEAMLFRINDAIAGSADSYELAYRINGMYGEIWQLPGDEAAATFSVASIAVSSAEYWETHTEIAYSDLQAAYGSCITSGSYSSAADAIAGCMGLSVNGYEGPAPTLDRGGASRSHLYLAQGIYKDAKCSYFNGRENAREDFLGGVAGAFVGGAAGVVAGILGTAGIAAPAGGLGGAVAGAVAGAGVMSGASFMFQFGESLYCTYSGGSGPGVQPSPT